MKMQTKDWAALGLLSLIWGATFLFGRIAIAELPPLTLTLARVAIAAIVLNIVLIFMSTNYRQTQTMWTNFAIMGVLNNIIPFGLIFYGQQEIGAGLASIINAMTPIWTVIIAHLATSDEKMSGQKTLGILFGFAGVGVLIGLDAFNGFGSSVVAQIAVLGATISYGFAAVFGRRFVGVPPVQTARGQLTMSSLILLPLALFIDQPWTLQAPSTPTILSVLALAIVCTAFAYILYFRILQSAGAVNAALVTFLIPPSAILLGILFLGETLVLREITGIVLIMTGLIIIDGRLMKRT
jgi:drug/metabolite transporter (DMT)-like permease